MNDPRHRRRHAEAPLLPEGHLHRRQPAGRRRRATVQASIDRTNALTCGHRACQGCGEALGARYAMDAAMRATGGNLIAVNATGCLEVFTTPYPETSWQMPWLHSLFGNAAAVATGVAAAMRVKGRPEVRVIAQGGDGGTTDIGFGCLSGMFERNDDVLYICYDNEGYMNTGVQRSSRHAAGRAHGDDAGRGPGARQRLRHRQERAADRHGARHPLCRDGDRRRPARPRAQSHQGDGHPRRALYPHSRALPARLGLGLARHHPLARLAVECGLFPVFEAEHGAVTDSRKIRRPVPVEEYLKPQRRFAHLFTGAAVRAASRDLQAIADRNIAEYELLETEERRAMKHPFAITLDVGSSLANHTGSWRTKRPVYVDRLPPCNHACPAGENIQGWLYHAEAGDYEAAWQRADAGQSAARRDGAGLLSPLRKRLQPRAAGRGRRHQFGRALPRRRSDQARLALRAAGSAKAASGYWSSARGRRAFRRPIICAAGPRRDDPRCRACGRRHDALRHPEIPPAARRAGRRNRAHRRHGRRAQAQCQGREYPRDA